MNENIRYHSGEHCRYLTQYHVIWCPKFRYPVLNERRQEWVKQILKDICTAYHYEIKALEVMPDHIHIFVDVPQTVAPCDVARALKSRSAIAMLSEDSELRKYYQRCGVLWSRGYFISTIGHVSEETVKRYIQEQKSHEGKM